MDGVIYFDKDGNDVTHKDVTRNFRDDVAHKENTANPFLGPKDYAKVLDKPADGYNIYRDMPTRLAIDWDGVLFTENGEYDKQKIEDVKELQEKYGVYIIIWTCRPAWKFKVSFLPRLIEEFGFTPDSINEDHPAIVEHYGSHNRKIHANFYIDDKTPGYLDDKWDSYINEIKQYQYGRIVRDGLIKSVRADYLPAPLGIDNWYYIFRLPKKQVIRVTKNIFKRITKDEFDDVQILWEGMCTKNEADKMAELLAASYCNAYELTR